MKPSKDIIDKIIAKWSGRKIPVYETFIESKKIQIDRHIYFFPSFLGSNKKEIIIEYFRQLCSYFIEYCNANNIPYRLVDLSIAFEALNRPLHWLIEGKSYIFIPGYLLEQKSYLLSFAFLHELVHAWVTCEYEQDGFSHEYFADLIAMCVFRKVITPDEEIYSDAVLKMSYIGNDEHGKKYFGEQLMNRIFREPELFLNRILGFPDKINFEHIGTNMDL